MKKIYSYVLIAMMAVLICCTNHRNNSGSMADSSLRSSDTTKKSQVMPLTPGGDGSNSPAEDSTRRQLDSMKNK